MGTFEGDQKTFPNVLLVNWEFTTVIFCSFWPHWSARDWMGTQDTSAGASTRCLGEPQPECLSAPGAPGASPGLQTPACCGVTLNPRGLSGPRLVLCENRRSTVTPEVAARSLIRGPLGLCTPGFHQGLWWEVGIIHRGSLRSQALPFPIFRWHGPREAGGSLGRRWSPADPCLSCGCGSGCPGAR